jgi:hypothetical protein
LPPKVEFEPTVIATLVQAFGDRPLSAGSDVMLKLANHGVVPIAGA